MLAVADMTAGRDVAPALAATATTALDATPAPAVTGQTVQLKATVDCGGTAPTGTVTFFDGTTILGQGTVGANGIATLNHAFDAGQHPLSAIYAGDTNCTGSTSNQITENVLPAGTVTTHTSSPNPSRAGQPVTLTATVTVKSPGSGTPTGTVSFFDQSNSGQNLGTATLGGNGNPPNQASLQISTLSAGQHNINAQYNGDSNFSQSTSQPATQTANPGGGSGLPAASIQLTSTPNPSTSGQQVTFTATVTCSGGTPTGSVFFREYPQGSTTPTHLATVSLTPVSGSNPPQATATYQTSSLAVGTHTITAIYPGDNVNCSAGPESAPVHQVVNAGPTTVGAQAPSESCSPAGNIPVGPVRPAR